MIKLSDHPRIAGLPATHDQCDLDRACNL